MKNPNRVIQVPLTETEIVVTLSQLTKSWAEPNSQPTIISVTDKLREALRGDIKK